MELVTHGRRREKIPLAEAVSVTPPDVRGVWRLRSITVGIDDAAPAGVLSDLLYLCLCYMRTCAGGSICSLESP